MYMRDDYKLAVNYGMQALEFGRAAGSLQNIAPSYSYLAVADAMHGKRKDAIQRDCNKFCVK